jgi:hypothetical protein
MLSLDGMAHLSASDLVGHLNCKYLTSLDLAVAKGELNKPSVWDPVLELLIERGALHEQNYLDHLETNGFPVLRIDGIGIDSSALAQTLEAICNGVPIVAQGALRVGRWGGRLDGRLLICCTKCHRPTGAVIGNSRRSLFSGGVP